jgi:hypothetical protein
MNNSPFEIYKTEKNRWITHWPTFKNIKDTETGIKLLDILFGQIKCEEVGLALLVRNGEIDTMWIRYSAWASDVNNCFSEYLQDMYEIRGVVFHKQHEAEQLQDILEKKYIWKVLQA